MTLLLAHSALDDRRRIAANELRCLADSLAADLAPVIQRDLFVPAEKARLSRDGGRCPRHGVLLDFDPFSPHSHRCPRCGELFDGDAHYRWWVMSYQLWLAERAVHGALLAVVRDDRNGRALAEQVVDAYAERYASYPNRDNVLGPTRLFFSTYLESIWLLQLCVAVDLLESGDGRSQLGDKVRDRVIEPSAALIASYDEGSSNRQSWNNAALLAAALILGRSADAERAVWGESGLASQLGSALLSDGTWYEGENYHLFAHRALWYGVQMCAVAGLELDPSLTDRFDAGFGAPFLGVLPDLTLPSRRDSQYAISVRQWRFAELCELGLARREDPVVSAILGRIYEAGIPRGDTGRASSAAESERNFPATALTRADLGWRSLLFARPTLPPLGGSLPRSALLDAQGYAVIRRGAQRDVYIALDYGHSGGGHGHPDRLNVQFAHGDIRWLDDVGTGSYVDPSLHWYRSTLAHNAPLANGRSQARVHGELLAWEDGGEAAWVDAEVSEIVPGVRVRRTLVALDEYFLDVVEWRASETTTIDLPVHLNGDMETGLSWVSAFPEGSRAPEDGFCFVTDSMVSDLPSNGTVRWAARRGAHAVRAWATTSSPHQWWRANVPGAPGRPHEPMYWLRVRGSTATVRTVFDWSGAVREIRADDERVVIARSDGATDCHARVSTGWRIERTPGWRIERTPGPTRTIDLGGIVPRDEAEVDRPSPAADSGLLAALTRVVGAALGGPGATDDAMAIEVPVVRHDDRDRALRAGIEVHLGESHYRRSEQTWREAGMPTAVVRLVGLDGALLIDVTVSKGGGGIFAPPRERNELDNEHPDTNSDGVQLYVAATTDRTGHGWILVPEHPAPAVRVSPIGGTRQDLRIAPHWEATADGYQVTCEVPLSGDAIAAGVDVDLIINEISPGRERRRGQLVLSGGAGEWIYLRGDRQPRARYVRLSFDGRGR